MLIIIFINQYVGVPKKNAKLNRVVICLGMKIIYTDRLQRLTRRLPYWYFITQSDQNNVGFCIEYTPKKGLENGQENLSFEVKFF